MILYSIEARDALRVPSGPARDLTIEHLFTVMTDPWHYLGSKKVIMVNISSIKYKQPYDQTCVITNDDAANDFITKDSFAFYRLAELREENRVIELKESGVIKPQGRLSEECFQRIAHGIQRSPNTREEIKTAYLDYLESNF